MAGVICTQLQKPMPERIHGKRGNGITATTAETARPLLEGYSDICADLLGQVAAHLMEEGIDADCAHVIAFNAAEHVREKWVEFLPLERARKHRAAQMYGAHR